MSTYGSINLDMAVERLAAETTKHEIEAHEGQVCRVERMHMVAWVAHRIGWFPLGPRELQELHNRITELWIQCPHGSGEEHNH